MAHIALAVRDQERSRRFYETYFEFDPKTARVAEDGVLLIEGPGDVLVASSRLARGDASVAIGVNMHMIVLLNIGDVLVALGQTDEPIRLPDFLHFGFRAATSPAEVRAFRKRLAEGGIEIVEDSDEPGYVSVKCRDPDGYVVEFAWEPD